MLRQALVTLTVLVLATPAFGQDVSIKWKLKEGDKLWFEDVVVQKQSVSVLGQAQKTDQKSTTISSFTVTKVTPENMVIVVKYEDVKATMEGGFGGDLDKIMEKMKGSTLTITMTQEGKVTKVDGLDALMKAMLGDQDETMKMLTKDMFTEENFTKSIEQAFAFIPDKAVKKGDNWTRVVNVPLGPLGSLKSINTYTYNGKIAEGEDIGVKQDMQYTLPRGDFAGLFKVTKGNLKADQATGQFIFDAAKGRLVSSRSSMRAAGTLTMDIGGQEMQMELSMEMTTTSRVLDKAPGQN